MRAQAISRRCTRQKVLHLGFLRALIPRANTFVHSTYGRTTHFPPRHKKRSRLNFTRIQIKKFAALHRFASIFALLFFSLDASFPLDCCSFGCQTPPNLNVVNSKTTRLVFSLLGTRSTFIFLLIRWSPTMCVVHSKSSCRLLFCLSSFPL